MNRPRKKERALTTTRIYQRFNKYCYFSAEAVVNPKTGKVAKWHSLCAVNEGETRARQLALEIQQYNSGSHEGSLPYYLSQYEIKQLQKREKSKPTEHARIVTWERGNKNLSIIIRKIKEGFADFNVDQVLASDVANFVDQWEGRRMAQVYLSRMSDFFVWCARKNLRQDNPCALVKVDAPMKNDRYITNEEYHKIIAGLMTGKDGKPTPSGPMVLCYIQLCYLLYQRTTEVRLLKWDQIQPDGIFFKPTKTERSTAATVLIPMTDAISAVLSRAKALGAVKGMYVIHKRDGKPYDAHGLNTAWDRACERAGVEKATLKQLRAKALTDAKKAGYSIEQLMVGAAHGDKSTTDGYIKRRETPISEVLMALPAKA